AAPIPGIAAERSRAKIRVVVPDERGMSLSVLVLLWIGALIIVAGLVVDGGQQVTAARRAESAAAGAARAAADAGGTYRLAGRNDPGAGVAAAQAYIAAIDNVRGTVTLSSGVVRVDTQSSSPTIFLSLLGIGEVYASAVAEADLVRGPDGP
ncbi:MAG: pilus assembly protein TadG-related protein, partial [Propionibacteriaceae bacterium]|nr:pilus assembly protein TadG-related protein [Propionibacteriaceae bacterium]